MQATRSTQCNPYCSRVRINPVGVCGKEPYSLPEAVKLKWRAQYTMNPVNCDLEPSFSLFLGLGQREMTVSGGVLLDLKKGYLKDLAYSQGHQFFTGMTNAE